MISHVSLRLDPVFFSSGCGQTNNNPANPEVRDAGDNQYSSSVAEGVEFAKANNLLGVLFDSELLVLWNVLRCLCQADQVYVRQLQVPSLIQGIRDAGLLVGIHGGPTNVMCEHAHVDAYVHDGTVVYTDHSAGD